MAERRMFAKTIIDSDAFLDMPLSTQALYFHLSMRADDDGFINNPKKIQRMIGANDNDLDLLLVKNFIIKFEDGICVIKHWRIHNYIQNDRYKETVYIEDKNMLNVDKNKAYTLKDTGKKLEGNTIIEVLEPPKDECIHDVSNLETQVRLGKDSIELGKDSIDKIKETWNSLNLSSIISIKNQRLKHTKARIKEVGEEEFIKAIESIKQSSFLQGKNDRKWTISYDWFINPNNFVKVLEGRYIDREVKQQEKQVEWHGVLDTSEFDSEWEEG